MAVIDFSNVSGAISFNPDADILAISGVTSAADLSISESGGSTSITVAGKTVTLTGVTLSQLASGNGLAGTADTANIIISGSSTYLFTGDDQSTTSADNSANTATGIVADGSYYVFGLGGGDATNISTSTKSYVVFGGTGVVDTTDGADTITTGTGSGTVYGNAGNDTIEMNTDGASAASVYGGIGNDTIRNNGTETGSLTLFGNAGNDVLNLANGGSFGGSVTVYGGNGTADSTDGNDTITLGTGAALVFANAGNDAITLNQTSSNATVWGGLGNDTVTNGAAGTGNYVFALGQGADSLDAATADFGASADVTIYGGDGIVDTADGADFIDIEGAAGMTALIYGNAGDDTITATDTGTDITATVFGGLGNDSITTEDNADSIVGGDGNDTVVAGAGDNTVDGGAGNNSITSTTGADIITTGDGNDTISAGAGANVIDAGAGTNSVTTTTGDDRITTGAGADTISSGDGDDTINAGDGADNITAGDGNNTLVNGEAGADTIVVGNGTSATVNGGDGNDTITGGTGGISLNGDAGSDNITGGTGADTLLGGTDSDTLEGAAGADSLTGGDGADTFEYTVALVDATRTNVDTITDFTSSDVFDFTDLTVGNLNGTGVSYQEGNAAEAATAIGTNTGVFVATNAATSLAAADIFTAIAGLTADANIVDVDGDDNFYLLISNGTDAVLALVDVNANTADAIEAADISFVATLTGVTNSELEALSASNFADFA